MGYRFGQLSVLRQRRAKVVVDLWKARHQLERFLILSDGLRNSSCAAKGVTKIVVFFGVARLDSFGLFILRDSSIDLSLLIEDKSEINTGNKVIGRYTQGITPQLFRYRASRMPGPAPA